MQHAIEGVFIQGKFQLKPVTTMLQSVVMQIDEGGLATVDPQGLEDALAVQVAAVIDRDSGLFFGGKTAVDVTHTHKVPIKQPHHTGPGWHPAG
jgi:hypothetical protein